MEVPAAPGTVAAPLVFSTRAICMRLVDAGTAEAEAEAVASSLLRQRLNSEEGRAG